MDVALIPGEALAGAMIVVVIVVLAAAILVIIAVAVVAVAMPLLLVLSAAGKGGARRSQIKSTDAPIPYTHALTHVVCKWYLRAVGD